MNHGQLCNCENSTTKKQSTLSDHSGRTTTEEKMENLHREELILSLHLECSMYITFFE